MLVARFIAGIGGSTAVAVLGGTLADLFSNEERGIPMAIFATVAFASTSVAPCKRLIFHSPSRVVCILTLFRSTSSSALRISRAIPWFQTSHVDPIRT